MCSGTLNHQEVPIGDYVLQSQYGLNSVSARDGNMPIIGMKDMAAGKITADSWARTHVDEGQIPDYLLMKGDILLNRTNSPDLVGKVSLWDREDEAVFASYLVRFHFDTTRALPEFVNHYLNWDDSQQRLKQISTRGVSQANINPTTFKNHFMVSWPSLPDQRRIAAILDEWDRAIATAEKLVKAKKLRKKALMRRLFGDSHNPFWVKGQKLSRLVTIEYGAGVPASLYDANGQALVIGTQGILGRTAKGQQNGPAIIVGRKGTLDKPFYVEEGQPFSAIDTTFILKGTPNLRCLFHYLTFVNLAKLNEASGVPSVSSTTLASLPVPTLSENATKFLNEAEAAITLANSTLTKLRLQKRGLMQKLLSGEWPVPASIDRLLPGGQDIDEAVGAEVQRTGSTG